MANGKEVREEGQGEDRRVPLRSATGNHVGRARKRVCLSLQGLPAPHNGSRWLKSQLRIEGEHKIYARKGDSGFEIRFHFCPNCGRSVFWEGDRSPTACGIVVGCFTDPSFPGPDFIR